MSVLEDPESKTNKLRDLFSGGNLRGLMLVIVLQVVSILSGSLLLSHIAHQIFGYNSGFSLTPSHCYMILGVVKILSGLVATQLIEIVGRKVLNLMSEIFSTLAAALAAFIVELVFPILNEAIGIHVSFFIFAFCCLSGTSIIFYIMPETKVLKRFN